MKSLADLGDTGYVHPPCQPKFLHFYAVFSENLSNDRLAHPLGLVPLPALPHLGNPGSATGRAQGFQIHVLIFTNISSNHS